MLIRSKRLILLMGVLLIGSIKAQNSNELRIQGKKVVSKGETFIIAAGTTVVFDEGASIEVEGSLVANGQSDNKIVFRSTNPYKPGVGIHVVGIDESSNINLNHVQFESLIQPLRFDPFWYRPSVNLKNFSIRNSVSLEPIVYVASPLIDLRDGKGIKFEVENAEVVNNQSGILLESFGSDGIQYELDKLYFGDNHIPSGDASMGMLHMDFASSANDIPSIGSLAFERNDASGLPVGLSVSGNSSQSVKVDGLYSADPIAVVFDQRKDNRVPSVSVSSENSVTKYNSDGRIAEIKHRYGDVQIITSGPVEVSKLLDSDGNVVELERNVSGDTQNLTYIQGNPTVAILSNGTKVKLPTVIETDIPDVAVTKIDTASYNEFVRAKGTDIGGSIDSSGTIEVGISFKIPTFGGGEGEIIERTNDWEIGVWGGAAVYGGGDIEHRAMGDFNNSPVADVPLAKDFPLYSSMEYSFGAYAQKNLNTRFSLKGSFYYSSISMHNMYAPLIISQGVMPTTLDKNYDEFQLPGLTFDLNFLTRMYIAEAEAQWHLRSYKIKKGKKSKLIPSLGLSLGAMHYTPYRIIYRGWRRKEYTYAQHKANVYENDLYNLRKIGTEGQNFLPGESPYSVFAGLVGGSFTLTYLRERWALKGEIKGTYTTTDYLDDYGDGVWYGGNYDKVKENSQIEDFSSSYPKQWSSDANYGKIMVKYDDLAANAPRSTDGLNDWYYQFHMGLSYKIFKK